MKPAQLESEIRVSMREWRSPALERKLYAGTSTPGGDLLLYRRKSESTAFDARANSLERWDFAAGENVIMALDDAAAPGISLQARMRAGVHGKLMGEKFRAQGKTSVIPGRRGIDF